MAQYPFLTDPFPPLINIKSAFSLHFYFTLYLQLSSVKTVDAPLTSVQNVTIHLGKPKDNNIIFNNKLYLFMIFQNYKPTHLLSR